MATPALAPPVADLVAPITIIVFAPPDTRDAHTAAIVALYAELGWTLLSQAQGSAGRIVLIFDIKGGQP